LWREESDREQHTCSSTNDGLSLVNLTPELRQNFITVGSWRHREISGIEIENQKRYSGEIRCAEILYLEEKLEEDIMVVGGEVGSKWGDYHETSTLHYKLFSMLKESLLVAIRVS